MNLFPNKKKTQFICLIIYAITLLVFYFAYPNNVPDYRIDQTTDSFTYISLAKSIINTHTYPTKHWMPGYPLILSFAISLFGVNLLYLKLMMIFIAIIAVISSVWLYKNIFQKFDSFLLALILASCPLFFDYSHRLMSEIVYIAFFMFTLASLNELILVDTGKTKKIILSCVFIISSICTLLIRGNALTLIPAYAFLLINPGRNVSKWSKYTCFLAVFILLITFLLWSWRCSNRTYKGIHNITYSQEVQAKTIGELWNAGEYNENVKKVTPIFLLKRVYNNLMWHQVYRIASITVPGAENLNKINHNFFGIILAVFFSLPVCIGFFIIFNKSPLIFFTLIGSFLLMLIYPTGGSARMLLPLFPLIIPAMYLGLKFMMGIKYTRGWLFLILCINLVRCLTQADTQASQPYKSEYFLYFKNIVENNLSSSQKK